MMSAIVCGKRSSSFFEELSSPPSTSSKRIRCSSSSSPTRFSPTRTSFGFDSISSTSLGLLRTVFPDMDQQLLERALEASGNDLDLAIKSLNELRIGSSDGKFGSPPIKPVERISTNIQLLAEANSGQPAVSGDVPGMDNLPADGSEWVELFVREMTHASNLDDARNRASRVLEVLEKDIKSRANAEASESLLKENLLLKEQVEGLLHDNNILKRAVAIQHERQKEFDERGQELQHLKQLVVHYQERLKTLEINNYALTLHLKQAQQSSSIPGRFHPDVF